MSAKFDNSKQPWLVVVVAIHIAKAQVIDKKNTKQIVNKKEI